MNPLTSRSLTLCLLAGVALLAGCNPPGKPGPEPEVVRPEQVLDFPTLYAQNCAGCHGANGKNGAAISLNNPVYLTIAGVSNNIERITANGVPNSAMPPFSRAKGGMLTDQQIAILANGIERNWGAPFKLFDDDPLYAAVNPGNPLQGQRNFVTYCAQCHGVDATGGKAPDGTRIGSIIDPSYLALISDQGLRSMILAGQFDKTPHDWRSYQASTGVKPTPITDQDVTDIVAWLAAHRIATPGQPYATKP